MTKSIIKTGRTQDEAVEAALREIGKTRDEVHVELLERAKSGFLGFGSTPAKVQVTWEEPDPAPAPAPKPAARPAAPKPAAPKPAAAPAPKAAPAVPAGVENADTAKVEEFLRGLFERMGVEAQAVARCGGEDNTISVELTGAKVGALIGRRGETLDAIQHLTNYVLNSGSEERTRVNIDAENYRAKRADALTGLARKTAARVVRYRRSQTLEPMNAYERHVIHTALQDFEGVTTYSTGTEPNRRVVIAYDPATAPADAGRERNDGDRPAYRRDDRRDGRRDDRRRDDRRRDSRPPRRSPSGYQSRPAYPGASPDPEKPPVDKTVREWN